MTYFVIEFSSKNVLQAVNQLDLVCCDCLQLTIGTLGLTSLLELFQCLRFPFSALFLILLVFRPGQFVRRKTIHVSHALIQSVLKLSFRLSQPFHLSFLALQQSGGVPSGISACAWGFHWVSQMCPTISKLRCIGLITDFPS